MIQLEEKIMIRDAPQEFIFGTFDSVSEVKVSITLPVAVNDAQKTARERLGTTDKRVTERRATIAGHLFKMLCLDDRGPYITENTFRC